MGAYEYCEAVHKLLVRKTIVKLFSCPSITEDCWNFLDCNIKQFMQTNGSFSPSLQICDWFSTSWCHWKMPTMLDKLRVSTRWEKHFLTNLFVQRREMIQYVPTKGFCHQWQQPFLCLQTIYLSFQVTTAKANCCFSKMFCYYISFLSQSNKCSACKTFRGRLSSHCMILFQHCIHKIA